MNKAIVVSVVAALGCASASTYLWGELSTEREQSQQLQARIAELERAASTKVQSRLPAEATVPVSPPATPPPAPAPHERAVTVLGPPGMMSANGRPMDPDMRQRMRESMEQQQRMLKDPEYRQLMREQYRMSMNRQYGDMELMLGLSKEEAERLRDVLAEQQLRAMENRPMMLPGDGPPDPAIAQQQQKSFEDMRRTNEAEITKVLGQGKYAEWQEYQSNGSSRMQVTRLREQMAGTAEPLREDQIKPLVQAMAREQQSMQRNTANAAAMARGGTSQAQAAEEWLQRTAQSQERIRNSVSSLLSPEQLAQLEKQQAQELKMQEINVRMSKVREQEAAARGETNSGAFVPFTSPNVVYPTR